MSTAVAETESVNWEAVEEEGSERKVEVFYSASKNLRLVRSPEVRELSAVGTQRTVAKGLRYDFAPEGRLMVRAGQDLLADGPIDPVTGQPKLQDAVQWLANHPLLTEYFHWEGHEPGRPTPTEPEFIAEMNKALMRRDAEALQAMIAKEKETFGRDLLINAAQGALAAALQTGAETPSEAVLDRDQLIGALQQAGVSADFSAATDEQLRAAYAALQLPQEAPEQ